MFEKFSVIGMENIVAADVIKGVVSFVVVVVGSTLIGLVCGLVGSLSTRFTHHARLTEPLFIYFICYLAYLVAELFHLSGILSYVIHVHRTRLSDVEKIYISILLRTVVISKDNIRHK